MVKRNKVLQNIIFRNLHFSAKEFDSWIIPGEPLYSKYIMTEYLLNTTKHSTQIPGNSNQHYLLFLEVFVLFCFLCFAKICLIKLFKIIFEGWILAIKGTCKRDFYLPMRWSRSSSNYSR